MIDAELAIANFDAFGQIGSKTRSPIPRGLATASIGLSEKGLDRADHGVGVIHIIDQTPFVESGAGGTD